MLNNAIKNQKLRFFLALFLVPWESSWPQFYFGALIRLLLGLMLDLIINRPKWIREEVVVNLSR